MRYALLVDGGFVSKALGRILRPSRAPDADEILAACTRIIEHPELRDHDLLRVLFYDAPPATGSITNPLSGERVNLGQTAQYATRQALLDRIESSPNFALRKGELAKRGWRVRPRSLAALGQGKQDSLQASDLQPHFEQKGVDLRIGLDIARLSLRGLVEIIVVVAGDSDFIPAFKFARREGLRVYLEDLGSRNVKQELRAHADLVLGTKLEEELPEASQAPKQGYRVPHGRCPGAR